MVGGLELPFGGDIVEVDINEIMKCRECGDDRTKKNLMKFEKVVGKITGKNQRETSIKSFTGLRSPLWLFLALRCWL